MSTTDTAGRPPRELMPPALPLGPRPPRVAGGTPEMAAGLDKVHAAMIRDTIVRRMIFGERAADVCRELARSFWDQSEGPFGPSRFDVPTFRWLQELGNTPDTPEGVVTLLRLAYLTQWQTFDAAGV